MAGADSSAGAARAGGLFSSIRNLVATLVAVVSTRLELFANEIHAEGRRLARMLVLGAAALFFLACSVLLFTFLLIAAFWDTHRLLAIGGCAVFYLLIGVTLAVLARVHAGAGTRLFEASLGELRKDRDRLSA